MAKMDPLCNASYRARDPGNGTGLPAMCPHPGLVLRVSRASKCGTRTRPKLGPGEPNTLSSMRRFRRDRCHTTDHTGRAC